MKTIEIKGHIFAKRYEWQDADEEPTFVFNVGEETKNFIDLGYVVVGPHTITMAVPAGWDFLAQELEALRKQKHTLMGEMQAKINAIDERISKLTAITYKPDTVEAIRKAGGA